ncbi:MMPL family transporter [Sansalvadorimonas sp. 2012CJ34-2]|uniref:MMPL family transporter n=1 Tax=Parendozoicomonas callyspongiae TaxID=2942213 RepID=A0ABT0PL19_9GAMM|nr:MMPL family transporter [Sansalvadorimonas sp. 2012CJ34-2]MCL6272090.1 MMPL family transporter [Sansalvadorimonas sp. 2012CJ34-2]
MSTHHFSTESFLERLIFNNRRIVLLGFFLATIFLVWKATGIRIDASFEKMIPLKHPFIVNWLERRDELGTGGNNVRIAVAPQKGDIFDADYMKTLQQITDDVFYLPGVDRASLRSLWTANVRWLQVTEEGFEGGPVIPQTYDGSSESLKELRANILRSGTVGRIVANDFKSSIITFPLFELNPETGEKLNYAELAAALEELRGKYADQGVNLHIIGFAKIVGDLFEGVEAIALFFLVALGITSLLLFMYSGCFKSTLIPIICSLVAVLWQLGLLSSLGLGLDLYSVLVPFLVFAIGVSHGVQIINNIGIESYRGSDPLTAARLSFRALYIPGMLALTSDAIGFLTLLVIDIDVIKDLALAASLGVAVIILTNLVLLPVLMSWGGVSEGARQRAHRKDNNHKNVWSGLSMLSHHKVAPISILIALCGFGYGIYMKSELKIGDLDPGAPELRADSRYNKDNAFITGHYSTSADIFVTMVETGPEQCSSFEFMDAIDRYMWQMETVPGVQDAVSMVTVAKQVIRGLNEGNPQWQALSRNQYVLNSAIGNPTAQQLYNSACSLAPVVLYLEDHKAETLQRVVDATAAFAAANNTDDVKFLMATGNAGVEAATNSVIRDAQNLMLVCVYSVVSILCLLTFRSFRAVICVIAPLALTSLLCQALMVHLGIGIKVATLPVIALGVGIGVDYGIYIYTRLETYLKQGMHLREAYYETLRTTGRAVVFTGVTLAIGVCTWIFSPIKFQADMGMLLTFMFLWNMIGAIWLLPALARFFIRTETISEAETEGAKTPV